jgi:hypothetical protein
LANKYQQHRSKRIPNAIGITMIIFGTLYVVLAAVLLSDTNLSINYARPILNELGALSQDELIAWTIIGDSTFIFAGVFGILFGYGILKVKKWAWTACVIYNIIFTLLCADAFANNTPLPDSYLVVVSVGLLVLLFMPATRAYFRPTQVIQK